MQAVASTPVAPSLAVQEPCACLARCPVSMISWVSPMGIVLDCLIGSVLFSLVLVCRLSSSSPCLRARAPGAEERRWPPLGPGPPPRNRAGSALGGGAGSGRGRPGAVRAGGGGPPGGPRTPAGG